MRLFAAGQAGKYILTIRVGNREFAPRVFTTVITLLLTAMLVSLGRWQLRRSAEKQKLYDEFAAGADATMPIDAATAPVPRFQHVKLTGRYDAARQILIDNMESPDNRVGYDVLTPFELNGGGWILVDRGWVPAGPSRSLLPHIPVLTDLRTISGRADLLPRPGIRLAGAAPLAPPFPVIADYPRLSDVALLLHEKNWARAAPVILLDPNQPDGYLRAWSVPGFPPMRYLAYAIQWFGLAATLLVIYVVTNLRRIDPAAKD